VSTSLSGRTNHHGAAPSQPPAILSIEVQKESADRPHLAGKIHHALIHRWCTYEYCKGRQHLAPGPFVILDFHLNVHLQQTAPRYLHRRRRTQILNTGFPTLVPVESIYGQQLDLREIQRKQKCRCQGCQNYGCSAINNRKKHRHPESSPTRRRPEALRISSIKRQGTASNQSATTST